MYDKLQKNQMYMSKAITWGKAEYGVKGQESDITAFKNGVNIITSLLSIKIYIYIWKIMNIRKHW